MPSFLAQVYPAHGSIMPCSLKSFSEGKCAGLQDYVVKSERGRLLQPSSTVL